MHFKGRLSALSGKALLSSLPLEQIGADQPRLCCKILHLCTRALGSELAGAGLGSSTIHAATC